MHEKAKRGELDSSSESDSESSEEEDENAELLTDEVDKKIQQVVTALRSNDVSIIKDSSVRFFDDENVEVAKKDKPVYLRDYHRMDLLGQLDDEVKVDENEQDESKLPYSVKVARDRARLVSEMHGDDNEDDEDEDDFMMKKVTNEREVEPIELPDPAEDPEKFLDSFMTSKAWLPSAPVRRAKSSSSTAAQQQSLDEDDSDFDEKADEFETKYNFRFEAGEEASQIVSYGRDVVDAHSIRRDTETPRQRQRRVKAEAKEQLKKQREVDRNRFKQLKVKEVMDKLAKIKQVAGIAEDEEFGIREEDLDADFVEDEWDEKMKRAFGDEFYGKQDTKPEWNDDIDINDIVPEYKSSDDDEEENDGDINSDHHETEQKISRRQQKKLEKKAKLESKKLKSKVEEFVDTQIIPYTDADEIASATSKKAKSADTVSSADPQFKFRYREVSPESFNMEPADILLADDKQLNEFVGLKKFAPYREPEKKEKDHKRYAKKKRLRQWRKEVFGDTTAPKWEELAPKLFQEGTEKKLKQGSKKAKK